MREIPIAKATILSILTLGIYYAIWLYRNSRDIHEGREGGHQLWQLWFWLGFITLFLTWGVLYIFNAIQLNELRKQAGMSESATGWIALGLYAGGFVSGFLGLVAPFIWATYSNETARSGDLAYRAS